MTVPRRARLPRRDASEIEGFLFGVEKRLEGILSTAEFRKHARAGVRRARRALTAGRPLEAETILLDIAARMDGAEPQPIVREAPRELIHYTTQGEEESATPEEEDALANRIRLVGKLLALRPSSPTERERTLDLLTDATNRLRRGDRVGAQSIVDELLGVR